MAQSRSLTIPAIGASALVAAAVFYVAYEDGSYSLASRSAIAIAVWWTILVAVVARVWPVEPIPKGAVVTGSLIAAFALWDLASTAWAASAENAYEEFGRTALYLGVYALAVLSTDRRRLVRVVDGLTVAIAAISVVALLSRMFPGLFPNRGLTTLLPSASTRLSFPLDYWNGLGIFVALAFPLLLHSALSGDRVRRAIALAAIPVLGAVVYLTASRGAVAALAGGVLVFVVAQPRRWRAVLERSPRVRAAAIVLVALVVAVLLYGTVRTLEHFTRLPTGDTGGEHLFAGGGSGRWQFWAAALHEFESSPFHGRGAGSYGAWWLQHGSFRYFVQNAHSLYLETLGELGIVGFVLLVGAFAVGVVVAVRRLQARSGAERSLIAALLGTLTAYLIGAGLDWMWELTAVTVVGVFVLGLLTGPATAAPRARAFAPGRLAVAFAAVVAGALLAAEAVSLLTDVEVRRSQADVRAGNPRLARSHAADAAKIEPWAATPYVQLALVAEAAGDLASARAAIGKAIHRDARDWRTWWIAARIERRLGDDAAATRSLARARVLNPRSPLVSQHT
jgi:O-antigen ligase